MSKTVKVHRASLERAIVLLLKDFYVGGVTSISLCALVDVPCVGKLADLRVNPASVTTSLGNAALVASLGDSQFVEIDGEVTS